VFNRWNRLTNYIVVIENAAPSVFCDEIVNYYEFSNEWKDAKIGVAPKESGGVAAVVSKDKRKCGEILLTESMFEKPLFNISKNCLERYVAKYPDVRSTVARGEAFSILKYKPDGFYTEHIDTSPMSPRVLSLSLVLNDGFTGGEFSFFGGKYKVKLKKGSAIMFPSNFMYPHAVLPIQKGVRYSIVTWYN
jgi:hypothetical protein